MLAVFLKIESKKERHGAREKEEASPFFIVRYNEPLVLVM
jgi:hypothetical protein